MKISQSDERLLYRFLDGELVGDEATACRTRLEREPLLRQGLQELQGRALGFAATRAAALTAPAGFTAAVLTAVRRLPDQEALRAVEVGQGIVVACRRLLVAAAILFGIGLLWQSGLLERALFGGRPTDTLTAASPAAVDREMQRLDAVIESWPQARGERESPARRERDGK